MSKSDTSTDAATSVTNLVESMRTAGLNSMPDFGTAWMEALADMGSEMLNFTAARIQRDVETQHALLHAKDLAEVQHIQAQFFQKVLDDYAKETAKMMEMGKAFAPKAVTDAVT